MEITIGEFAGLPSGRDVQLTEEGRTVDFSRDADEAEARVLLSWRSPNDQEITLIVGFPRTVERPEDEEGMFTVFVGEKDIVEDGIFSTGSIAHDKLRAEVEWAIGVAVRAAADARAGRPGPWIDPADDDAARIRGLLELDRL